MHLQEMRVEFSYHVLVIHWITMQHIDDSITKSEFLLDVASRILSQLRYLV